MTAMGALPRLVLASGGLIVWSSCFLLLYVVLSLGCEAGMGEDTVWSRDVLALVLTVLWGLHLVVLGVAVWLLRGARARPMDENARFLLRLTCLLMLVGAAGTIWIGAPVLALPPCY
ncbi:MAG: hypothetical protein ACK4QW_00990 [Alphaproteobacteria bacterium]